MKASQALMSSLEFRLGGNAAITRTLGRRRWSSRTADTMSLSADTIIAVSKSPMAPSATSAAPRATSLSFSSYSNHDDPHEKHRFDFRWKRPTLISSKHETKHGR